MNNLAENRAWMRSGVILAMVEFLESQGLDAVEVLGSNTLKMVEAADTYRQVDMHYMMGLFQTMAERTDRMELGMELGLQADLTQLGPWGLQFLNAPNLGTALRDFVRFGPVFQTQTHFGLARENRQIRLEYSSNRRTVRGWEIDNEVSITYMMGIVNTLSGEFVCPLEIHFEHSAICEQGRYLELLGIHPLFNQAINQVVYPAAIRCTRIAGASPEYYRVLTRHLSDIAASLPPQESLSALVTNNIRRGLDKGEDVVTLEHVASELGINARSLQRQLKSEGTSFQVLMDDVRLKIARYYLQRTSLELVDLAAELGYSQSSAFSRAFKRWTGVSPGQYRDRFKTMS